jgi:phage repressor protein C with HTH and peptisase S24 domain
MRTLAERLTWAREQKKLTQEGLAKLSGVSQSTIGNLEAGIRLTARKIIEIAAALDVDPMWLSNGTGMPRPGSAAEGRSAAVSVEEPRPPYLVYSNAPTSQEEIEDPFVIRGPSIFVGDEPDTIKVQRVQIRLRAGFTGFETVPEIGDGSYLHIPQKVVEQLGVDPQFLIATRSAGCSMEPMIFDNEWVVVNTIDRSPVDRKIFAVNFNGEACIKQLLHEGGQWYLHSLNPDFGRVNVKSGQCEIIGRVVYQPGRLVTGA